MDNDYIVSKSNYFIMSSAYDLSLEEQRIILTLASMVQPSDEEFKLYKFKISEFIKLLGIKDQSKYSVLPVVTKELMKKVFEIETDNSIIQVAWLSSAEYIKETGTIELEFSPKLKPYFLQLKSFFTNYKLSNILSMKSKYSPRLYEILKMNEFNKKGFKIEVKELRKLFKAEKIYSAYKDFKVKVLEQAQKEINEYTDITFDFKEQKISRKVDSIIFFVRTNSKSSKPKNNESNKIKKTQKLIEKFEIAEENSKKIVVKIKKTQKEFEDLIEKICIENDITTTIGRKAVITTQKKLYEIIEETAMPAKVKKSKKENQLSLEVVEQEMEIKVHNFSEEEKIELQAELGINLYTINENNYNRDFFSFKKTDKENAKDEIDNYIFKYDNDWNLGEHNIKEKSVENFLIINPLYNKQSLLDNFNSKEVRKLINPYIAKEMSNFLLKTDNKTYKIPKLKKLYTKTNIPNELLLDKKGKVLVGSAKESRIDKILREQENYLKKNLEE